MLKIMLCIEDESSLSVKFSLYTKIMI